MWPGLAFLLITGEPTVDHVQVFDVIKDAQATNSARLNAGTMMVRVSYSRGKSKTAILAAAYAWKGDNGFWAYRLSDPDKLLTPSRSYAGKLEDCAQEYMLVNKGRLFIYNAYLNNLHIYPFTKQGNRPSSYFLFDLSPTTNWHQCCPPIHPSGRPWAELIGDSTPGTPSGSTVKIERVGEDQYKQTRTDPDRGTFEATFSMRYAGYPVSYRYTMADGRIQAQGTYAWSQTPSGTVVLNSGHHERDPGSGNHSVYDIIIEYIDVESPIPNSKFEFEEFKGYMPKNTEVSDHISNTAYPLFKTGGLPTADLKSLSNEIRSRGFLRDR
jgi:hypothetical protein